PGCLAAQVGRYGRWRRWQGHACGMTVTPARVSAPPEQLVQEPAVERVAVLLWRWGTAANRGGRGRPPAPRGAPGGGGRGAGVRVCGTPAGGRIGAPMGETPAGGMIAASGPPPGPRPRPGKAATGTPWCATFMTRLQISVGSPPPVAFLVGEESSLPTQTP